MRSIVAAVSVLVLVIGDASGAVLSVDHSGDVARIKMMRRETEEQARRRLHGDGDLDPNAAEALYDTDADADANFDMCNFDYPVGKKDVSNCTEAHEDYRNILTQAECIQAAKDANATVIPHKFRITMEWYDHHPKGCFREACAEDPKGICYFYNQIGDEPEPSTVRGYPVCARPRYKNGTADGTLGVECHEEGYASIMDEATCHEAGICIGFCDGSEFRMATHNASTYDEFPLGCFIHADLGCVFFNPRQDGIDRLPQHPRGTPVCNVTSTTFYPWKKEYEKL